MSATQPSTFGIGVKELRPCDCCGKPIAPVFYHVQVRRACINRRNVGAFLGTAQILGGGARAMAIAEAMAPGTDAVAEVLDEPITLLICTSCLSEAECLTIAMQRRSEP